MLTDKMCGPFMRNAVPGLQKNNHQMHKEWARQLKAQCLMPSSKTALYSPCSKNEHYSFGKHKYLLHNVLWKSQWKNCGLTASLPNLSSPLFHWMDLKNIHWNVNLHLPFPWHFYLLFKWAVKGLFSVWSPDFSSSLFISPSVCNCSHMGQSWTGSQLQQRHWYVL